MERTETIELSSFLAVAEAGSFRQAASMLNVGQSAVSRRIQKLEDRLGVSLFERQSIGTRLTIAGTCFAVRAKAILDDVDTAVTLAKAAGRAEIGVLRVGLVASLSRGPIRQVFSSFSDRHPNVELCISEADRRGLFIKLSHRELDVVVAAGEHSHNEADMLVSVIR